LFIRPITDVGAICGEAEDRERTAKWFAIFNLAPSFQRIVQASA
jgi:hypothetical protein